MTDGTAANRHDDCRESSALSTSIPLGSIARRVPVVTAAERKLCGASDDPSFPIRCIFHGDFSGGLLSACGTQFLERLPERTSPRKRGRCLLRPWDLVFSRVGASFLGTVPKETQHELVATDNIVAMRLDIQDEISMAAISRYLARGADGQLDELRAASGRSVRHEDFASIRIPAPLVPGTGEFSEALPRIEGPAMRYAEASSAATSALRGLAETASFLDAAIDGASPQAR